MLGSPGVRGPVRVGAVPLSADCYQDRGIAFGGAATTTLVVGMGGVGKTQVVARYVRPFWDDSGVEVALWVTAVDVDSIVAGYARAAQALGVGHQDLDVAAQAFLNWLATTGRSWVIVLDDLQDPDHLKGWWPPHVGTGHTIITTRRRDAALLRADRRLVEVSSYTATESLSYLRAKLLDQPRFLDGAAELADELGHLPLALAQAVAYLLDTDITCADYLRRFRSGRDTTPDRLPDDHQRTVDRTWELSVDHADRLTPAGLARPLLELLSMLDPNGVPHVVVTNATVCAYLGVRADRRITPDDAARAVRCLYRLSLATTDPERGVRVHALVQQATRSKVDLADEALLAVASAAALLDSWPDIERDREFAQRLRANAVALQRHAGGHLWHPDAHAVLHRYGQSLGEAGLVTSATAYFEHLCVTAVERLGPDHLTTLTFRGELAVWRGYAGDVTGAVFEAEHLLADRIRVQGPDHESTLVTRHNLAHWRGEAGDIAGAVAELEQLLAIESRVLGPDDPGTLTTRHNLAQWRGKAGDAAGASAELRRLLADWVRLRGADDPDTMTVRHEVAQWRGQTGDAAGAVAEFERLLADRVRVQGADHPHTLTARHDLARWRGEAGDGTGAVAEFERLVADQVRLLGPEHPNTLTSRSALAGRRALNGDVAGALVETAALLADRLRVLGPDHPATLLTRGDLATYRGACGDVAGAVAETEKLLADRLRVLGPDHPDTLRSREHLAYWQKHASR